MGSVTTYEGQEFWFDQESHALLFWITWGT
jgi:hypothetical protein